MSFRPVALARAHSKKNTKFTPTLTIMDQVFLDFDVREHISMHESSAVDASALTEC